MLLCENFIVHFHVYYHCKIHKAKGVGGNGTQRVGFFLKFVTANLHQRALERTLLIEYLRGFFIGKP